MIPATMPALGRRRRWAAPDWVLGAAVLALCPLGVVLVWASTRPRLLAAGQDPQEYLKRQAIGVVVGLLLMIAVAAAGHRALRAYTVPVYALSCLGLLFVLTPLGATVNGSQAWIRIGAFQAQPSEFAKPALVLALATVLADLPDRERRPRRTQVLLALGAAAIPLGLVMLQPDLGTFLILGVTALGMLALAGTRPLWLVALLGAAATAGVLAWWLHLLQPHQIERLTAFTDPSVDPQGIGYNATQALITIGSGGAFGRGLFHGDQTGGRFVPEQHTDFIFTTAGEELGFAGAAAILVLLWIVLWRALRIAARAESPFGALAAAGIACWLAAQTFINVGMTIGLAPIVGVPLPFLSYGGSSIIACLLAMGVLQAVHRHDTETL